MTYGPHERNDDYLDVSRFVWRHRRVIFLTSSVGFLLTVAYLSLAERIYESEVKIVVRLEGFNVEPTVAASQYVAVTPSSDSEVLAVHELLSSRFLAEKVVDHFGPAQILGRDPSRRSLGERLAWLNGLNLNPLRVYSFRDKAVCALQQQIAVSATNKSHVLTVTCEAGDPRQAQQILETLFRLAREEHLRIRRSEGSQEFLTSQAHLFEREVAQLEEQLREVKDETGFSSLPVQRDLQLQLVESLTADRVRAQAELEAVQAELQHRRDQLTTQPALIVTEETTGQPQSPRQSFREKIYDMEIGERRISCQVH